MFTAPHRGARLHPQLRRAINILWPRPTGGGWAEDYLLIMTTVGVVVVGWIYMLVSKAYTRGDAPSGDASGAIKTVTR